MTHLLPAVNSNDYIYGNPHAAIELVEYGDYQCPYCGRAYPIVKEIQQELGSDLKFVFRNFPLKKIHPEAFAAAVAARAAGQQGKYWEMHDIIFENQKFLHRNSFVEFADLIQLDLEIFNKDIQREDLAHYVQSEFINGIKNGVNRTPSFFVNGIKYEGSWEKDIFLEFLKLELMQISIS